MKCPKCGATLTYVKEFSQAVQKAQLIQQKDGTWAILDYSDPDLIDRINTECPECMEVIPDVPYLGWYEAELQGLVKKGR